MIGLIFEDVGMVSPSKNPQGFKGSIWSQITFMMASNGIDKNIPDIPHKAFPANTTKIAKSALILTFEETIKGTIMLLSISCMI